MSQTVEKAQLRKQLLDQRDGTSLDFIKYQAVRFATTCER
ncbi:hypothetical protein DYY67_0574 [Candidatus Nitrosotalea sp. TS]|nr:hypothetical protein [Candidatus Nitrosotalea sp. TS]